MTRTYGCDFIVIGSGIAGLRAALELSREGTVRVFCKGEPWESNTSQAQGGIAAAMQEGDTVEFHLQDTLNAGDGLCNEEAVRVLVEEGPRRIQELVEWGAEFDRVNGKFVFGREGAHSRNRILHAGDGTGKEIVRALLNWVQQSPGIKITAFHPAVDFVLRDGTCVGIQCMDERTGEHTLVQARAVLLATGGAGQIYSHTTNPQVATGDGIAMAYRAGAELMDLEFFQFHPTAFHFGDAPRFLLTEALRGEGAVLRNVDGKEFMHKHHAMGDLAPRDIVSRGIVSEMKETQSAWVYLDATHLKKGRLRDRFPNIFQFLLTYELDLSKDRIPVSPSAHYWMGGIRTDLDGATSIRGLYAAGEAACNGVHGANRLASNSLLEGLVFGARAGEAMRRDSIAQSNDRVSFPETPEKSPLSSDLDTHFIRRELQSRNWESLGLIREKNKMEAALHFMESIGRPSRSGLENLELLNLLDCSKLVGSFALHRQESRGSHFREDFPLRSSRWDGHHSVLRNGRIELTTS